MNLVPEHGLQILATGQKTSRVKCGMMKVNPSLLFREKTAVDCFGDELEHSIQIQMRA